MEAALKAEVATEVETVEALAAEVREAAEMMEATMAASKEAAKAELAAHSSLSPRSRPHGGGGLYRCATHRAEPRSACWPVLRDVPAVAA